jgi:hypothetical protein
MSFISSQVLALITYEDKPAMSEMYLCCVGEISADCKKIICDQAFWLQ